MEEINSSLLFIITISIAMVNPVGAECIDNKITVYTNIHDPVVTIQWPEYFSSQILLREGETWDISNGYALTIQSINVDAGTGTLIFKRNGSVLDQKVVSKGETYTYDSIFKANLDAVFVGMNTNLVKFENIYFFSEPYCWKFFQSGTTSMKSSDQWYYWESNYIDFRIYNKLKVSYGSIDGYLKPADEIQTIDGRNCIEFKGVYRGGDITITSNIAEASFTISGPGGYNKCVGGTSFNDNNVMGGSYTVNFMDVSGYTTPGVQEKTVTPGSVTYFSVTYIPLPTPTTTTPPSPTTSPTPSPTTSPTPSTTPTQIARSGEGGIATPTSTPTPTQNGDIDTLVIVALIGALATIIAAYFGYLAVKKNK